MCLLLEALRRWSSNFKINYIVGDIKNVRLVDMSFGPLIFFQRTLANATFRQGNYLHGLF